MSFRLVSHFNYIFFQRGSNLWRVFHELLRNHDMRISTFSVSFPWIFYWDWKWLAIKLVPFDTVKNLGDTSQKLATNLPTNPPISWFPVTRFPLRWKTYKCAFTVTQFNFIILHTFSVSYTIYLFIMVHFPFEMLLFSPWQETFT